MIKKILIPVYNDWSSLKTLLNKLEYSLKPGKYEILIVNDFSNTREKFNSTMQAQINQSNAAWRRQINTVNTATQNEANRQNALNVLGINQNALNNLWQTYRDEAGWLFTEGMTTKQYAHEIAKMNLNASQQRALYNLQVKGDAVESIGAVIVDAAIGIEGE